MYVKVFWSKFSSSMKLQLKWVSWKCDVGVVLDDGVDMLILMMTLKQQHLKYKTFVRTC